MRVFISADIEGTAFTTVWPETGKGQEDYPAAARQMTLETKAACEGAIAAGADYILIKDAHGSGRNIDPTEIPACAEILRGPEVTDAAIEKAVSDAGYDLTKIE